MPAQSFIDASVTIVGDLRSEGDVQLDGHICGNVQCAQLIVGRHAAITGAVTAEQLVVRGRITGTIRARLVVLQHTARIESDITYSLLAMDEGASFEGAAWHRSDPLQDADAVSSFAELQKLVTNADAGGAGCNGGNGRRPETGHPPSGRNCSLESDREGALAAAAAKDR